MFDILRINSGGSIVQTYEPPGFHNQIAYVHAVAVLLADGTPDSAFGNAGNSWHTAANWDCNQHGDVPGADDAVTIAPAGTVEVLLGAEGALSNTDGGTVSNETEVNGPGTYILGFAGVLAAEIEVVDAGAGPIERLTLTWHGQDHPDAALHPDIADTLFDDRFEQSAQLQCAVVDARTSPS